MDHIALRLISLSDKVADSLERSDHEIKKSLQWLDEYYTRNPDLRRHRSRERLDTSATPARSKVAPTRSGHRANRW